MPDLMADPTDVLTDDEFDAQQIVDWLETRSLSPDDVPPVPTSAREGELRYAHQNTKAWRLVPADVLKRYGLTAAQAQSLMDRSA